jgi:hypothetical protein
MHHPGSGRFSIHAASIERRLSRGDRRVAMTMGFTSRAKMLQMGLPESRKRPDLLSITHKLHSDHDAQFYVGES